MNRCTMNCYCSINRLGKSVEKDGCYYGQIGN